MSIYNKIHREIIAMSPEDCFLVESRTKDYFDYPLHYHPEIELNFVLNGEGVRRIIGDSVEEITNTELVLVGPNVYHMWEQYNGKNKNIQEVTIQFHKDLFDEAFLKRSVMKPIKDMLQRSAHGILFAEDTVKMLSPRILMLSKLDGFDHYMEMLSLLYDLAISRNQRLLSTSTILPENFNNDAKITKMYDFIQENYASKITLAQMSSLLHMSNVSFNRFIKRRTGKTFVEYLNDVRLGYAARWLIEKDLSVSEIAFTCGFNSIANFNRVFRKTKGFTPTQYRQVFSGVKRVL